MYHNSNSKPFGLPQKEGVYDQYIGKEYIIRPIGLNDHFVGNIKDIDSERGKITLNPYVGSIYSKKFGRKLYKLIYRNYDAFVNLTNISFEPTTKKDILHTCEMSNKDEKGSSPERLTLLDRIKISFKLLTNKH